MGGERAAMVFADPPYNVCIRSIQGRGKIKHGEFAMASGEMSQDAVCDLPDRDAERSRPSIPPTAQSTMSAWIGGTSTRSWRPARRSIPS